jgi:hypothetical protein
VALYSKDAVLWGTLSSTVRSDPAGLKAYFVGAFQALPKLTVKFGEQFIRVYGDTAVNTGYSFGQSLRAREGECELGTLAIGKRCQEWISATGWAW